MSLLNITHKLKQESFVKAHSSSRRRHPVILHENGAYLNRVYNFICEDSYMHPHLHPGHEKIEVIQILMGSATLLLFDDLGRIIDRKSLDQNRLDRVEVPAFTWHTYVMTSNEVITYETMNGIYDPSSWKVLAPWAPNEGSNEAKSYLQSLRKSIL